VSCGVGGVSDGYGVGRRGKGQCRESSGETGKDQCDMLDIMSGK
jgi:hypothetical protein